MFQPRLRRPLFVSVAHHRKKIKNQEKEECNNFDDNCNQLIDEDLYAQCYTANPSTLYMGICEPGDMTCLEGLWGNYKEDDPNFITGFTFNAVLGSRFGPFWGRCPPQILRPE